MSRIAPSLLVLVLLPLAALAASWQVVGPAGAGAGARARGTTPEGAARESDRHAAGAVGAGFVAPHPRALVTPCPSLAIDALRPPFTFDTARDCTLAAHRARVIAQITGNRPSHPLLYHLMNGNQAILRYRTSDRSYHRAASRCHVKQAMLRVLGRNLDVQAGDAQ